MPDVMIVVPTYNEVEGLERTVGRLRQSVPHAELVIIDDGSPDGTGELADRLSKADAKRSGTMISSATNLDTLCATRSGCQTHLETRCR